MYHLFFLLQNLIYEFYFFIFLTFLSSFLSFLMGKEKKKKSSREKEGRVEDDLGMHGSWLLLEGIT